MSLDSRGIKHQRLLSQSLEDRIIAAGSRAAGFLMLATSLALWACLVSWSSIDPSLSNTTAAPPANWLGAIGAILSDLFLQTLGFATVLVLIVPTAWSFELVANSQLDDGRTRIGFYLLSILAAAGALSALPVPDAWPMHHGLGGALGDGLFNLLSSLFAFINTGRSGLASGLVLCAATFVCTSRTLAISSDVLWNEVRVSFAKGAVAWDQHQQARRARSEARKQRIAEAIAAQKERQLELSNDNLDEYVGDDDEAPIASPATVDYGVDDRHRPRRNGLLSRLTNLFSNNDAADSLADARQNVRLPEAASSLTGYASGLATANVPPPPPSHIFENYVPSLAEAPNDALLSDEIDAESRAMAERFAPGPSTLAERGVNPDEQPPPPVSSNPSGLLGAFASPKKQQGWQRPSLNLLKRTRTANAGVESAPAKLRENAKMLENVLGDFGVKGAVKDIRPGPVVILYELEPARGTKSSRVIGLADDIARSMSVTTARAAVVPGRNAIGLELPNACRQPVGLRELFETEVFAKSSAALPLALGRGISGEPIVSDLARMPHLLVAGTTGSGKSVGINAMILSLLYRHAPENCRLLMIDPKMLELSVYNDIPHLLTPVVTEPEKAVVALNWAVSEMEERYKKMAALNVRNIDVYNNQVRNAKKRGDLIARTVQTGFDNEGRAVYEKQTMPTETMPRIVIFVDEFADLMMIAGKEVEAAVQRLAQMARAAGIHLIIATQRPSVDVITGTIKANFPTRISFKVTSKVDSRTILNEQGAEQLLGQGDMLFAASGGQTLRVHGAFVSDEEVEEIAAWLRAQQAPEYVPGVLSGPPPASVEQADKKNGGDDLYDQAVEIIRRDRKASTSYLQRRLSIGYNRAADLIERLERDGIISAANHVGRRDVLAPPLDSDAA